MDEYPLPPGANITQVHVIHRHGARYPTLNDGPEQFGKRLAKLVADGVRFEGELSFLNDWNYELGDEMLVARGRQELFDSGILHWYNYGRLHDPSTKIVARTTTQYRMLQSAENFMAGFFGFDWRDNVTIEAVIEANGFNGSASAYNNCPNSSKRLSYTADEAVDRWKRVYLADATRRFQQLVRGNYTWTVDDSYNMQQLCPYETVALGFSRFCQLFTYDEWKGLEYSDDMQWYGDFSFGSPTARAVGIGQVVETLARMEGQPRRRRAGRDRWVAEHDPRRRREDLPHQPDPLLRFQPRHPDDGRPDGLWPAPVRAVPARDGAAPEPAARREPPHALCGALRHRGHQGPAARVGAETAAHEFEFAGGCSLLLQHERPRSGDQVRPLPGQPADRAAREELPGLRGPRRRVVRVRHLYPVAEEQCGEGPVRV